MAAQVVAATCQRLSLCEVVEGGRQAVGAVLLRYTAEVPQRRLQPGRQGEEALAADADRGMTPAQVSERELVQPVWACRAVDLDAEFVADGEVRQTERKRGLSPSMTHKLLVREIYRMNGCRVVNAATRSRTAGARWRGLGSCSA